MIRRLALLGAIAAAPAAAVGLAPLSKQGLTDGPSKAFYLTVINPYPRVERFDLQALAPGAEAQEPAVRLIPQSVAIGGGGSRRVLVIADSIAPGTTRTFRVCAERTPLPTETIHARVCSTLSARRVGRA